MYVQECGTRSVERRQPEHQHHVHQIHHNPGHGLDEHTVDLDHLHEHSRTITRQHRNRTRRTIQHRHRPVPTHIHNQDINRNPLWTTTTIIQLRGFAGLPVSAAGPL